MMPYILLFLFAALLAAIRLIKGPTAPDRMVALDTTSTIMVAALVMLSIHFNRPYLLDIAIMYAMLSFVATAAISKYLRGQL